MVNPGQSGYVHPGFRPLCRSLSKLVDFKGNVVEFVVEIVEEIMVDVVVDTAVGSIS